MRRVLHRQKKIKGDELNDKRERTRKKREAYRREINLREAGKETPGPGELGQEGTAQGPGVRNLQEVSCDP